NGTITVSAPSNKGQLRVLVKGWTGGKIGTDGKFIYTTSAVAHGGSVKFTDPGTTEYYTKDDVVGDPEVTFSPAGGTFKTETVNVTATLNETAVSGWYQVEGKSRVNIANGAASSFTLGEGMQYGQTVKVTWGAKDAAGAEFNGTATYKKVDPNATITVYVKSSSSFNMYAWGNNAAGTKVEPCGAWPGKQLTDTKEINGTTYKYFTFDDMEAVNVIFNNGSAKTADITGITSDKFFEYDGNTGYKEIQENVTPTLSVKLNPNGGDFVDKVNVTISASNATSAWYKIGNGSQVSFTNNATFTLGADMQVGQSVTVSWSATDGTETKTGSATFKKVEKPAEPEGITVYYDNSQTNWGSVKVHYWGGESASEWPGVDMAKVEGNIWKYTVPTGTIGVVFNNGNS
ncbi:MAG: starch-binding protein, partial [Muribaculaceae bacterium]|nr:starch-binding protein [Muribaculaceae bacterium]